MTRQAETFSLQTGNVFSRGLDAWKEIVIVLLRFVYSSYESRGRGKRFGKKFPVAAGELNTRKIERKYRV